MPQPSYPYACARLSALEKGLLDKLTVKRMADGSLEDALRTLLDLRYGGMNDVTGVDIEQLIEAERVKTAQELIQLSPDPELTNLFLLSTDVQNLKILLKARCMESTEAPFSQGGLFDKETLKHAVSEQAYHMLPKPLQERLYKLEERLRASVEPQYISVMLDQGYYAHCMETAMGRKDGFLKQYFMAVCDFNNLITFLRLRAMGAGKEQMRALLLPTGAISERELLDAYELSYETLFNVLTGNPAREALVRGLDEMLKSGNIGALERERDNYLLSLVNGHRYERRSIFPIIGYYLARQREAQAIRLIITVKKNGLEDGVIAERLRELYG